MEGEEWWVLRRGYIIGHSMLGCVRRGCLGG